MATQQQLQYQVTLQSLTVLELEVERDAALSNGDIAQMHMVVNELLSRQAQVQQPVQPQVPSTTQQPSFVLSKIKIEKPKPFNGHASDLSNFLFGIKQYADTVGLTDDVGRQQLAATLLRGRAMTWWRTWVDRIPNLPNQLKFADFEVELEKQFRDVDHIDRLRRKLSGLKQTTSVARYIDAFREIVIELGNNKPDADSLLFQFINGLKRDVQLHVRLTQPKDLISAELVAEQTDSALYLSHHRSYPPSHRSNGPVPMELGFSQTTPTRRAITCYRCGKAGHIKRNCRVNLAYSSGTGDRGAAGGRGTTRPGGQAQGSNLRNAIVQENGNDAGGAKSKN